MSVNAMMMQVIYALIPGIAAYVFFFGWGVVIHVVIALLTALGCEVAMLLLRRRPVMAFLGDGSAALTAVLLALCLPPLAPWWTVFVGTAFAIIFAKHLYGGLGYNPFNPAMIGYAMLLISFPVEMTGWLPPAQLADHVLQFTATVNTILTGRLPDGLTMDALTMATPLDIMKIQLGLNKTVSETLNNPLFSYLGGTGWEWINIWFLAGGLWLVYRNVITWHIPVALFTAIYVIAGIFYVIDADANPSPVFHIYSGATVLGAFFIATDPVTACTTSKGRLVYGAGIGVITYIIRTWGGYPDGIAFAVLLMNMAAPTIDYYTQPRVFGRDKGNHE